jgi:hypothetical protein
MVMLSRVHPLMWSCVVCDGIAGALSFCLHDNQRFDTEAPRLWQIEDWLPDPGSPPLVRPVAAFVAGAMLSLVANLNDEALLCSAARATQSISDSRLCGLMGWKVESMPIHGHLRDALRHAVCAAVFPPRRLILSRRERKENERV